VARRREPAGRTGRILFGAALGALPGILLLATAFVIETWVDTGGGLGFGITGIVLLPAGAALGAGVASGRLAMPTDPRLGALAGAVPGLLLVVFAQEIAVLLAIVGALVGYRLVNRNGAGTT
jgi:hypothetical protein